MPRAPVRGGAVNAFWDKHFVSLCATSDIFPPRGEGCAPKACDLYSFAPPVHYQFFLNRPNKQVAFIKKRFNVSDKRSGYFSMCTVFLYPFGGDLMLPFLEQSSFPYRLFAQYFWGIGTITLTQAIFWLLRLLISALFESLSRVCANGDQIRAKKVLFY